MQKNGQKIVDITFEATESNFSGLEYRKETKIEFFERSGH